MAFGPMSLEVDVKITYRAERWSSSSFLGMEIMVVGPTFLPAVGSPVWALSQKYVKSCSKRPPFAFHRDAVLCTEPTWLPSLRKSLLRIQFGLLRLSARLRRAGFALDRSFIASPRITFIIAENSTTVTPFLSKCWPKSYAFCCPRARHNLPWQIFFRVHLINVHQKALARSAFQLRPMIYCALLDDLFIFLLPNN